MSEAEKQLSEKLRREDEIRDFIKQNLKLSIIEGRRGFYSDRTQFTVKLLLGEDIIDEATFEAES